VSVLLFDELSSASAAVTPAPAFRRDGKVFRCDDGSIFPFAFGSEFAALRLKMDGVNMQPFYDERYAVGQRGFSFFLTSEIAGGEAPDGRLGDGGPYSDAEILDALGPFVDELRAHGFNSDACVFQAVKVTMPQTDRQVRFWNRVLDIAKVRPWMSVCVSQEWYKQINALAFDGLRRPSDQTWDGGGIGDGINEGVNVAPGIWVCPMRGSHDSYEASRNADWPSKTKSALDISGVTGIGCVTREPMGADEENQPGRRSNVVHDFIWSAATARLTSLGSYFHSQAGIRGQLYGPRQREIATAHYHTLASIPCEAQLSPYQRGSEFGGPGVGQMPMEHTDVLALRTYCKQVDGVEYCVAIRPAEGWAAIGRDGWRVATEPSRGLVELVR
jgi:hypothetical protein